MRSNTKISVALASLSLAVIGAATLGAGVPLTAAAEGWSIWDIFQPKSPTTTAPAAVSCATGLHCMPAASDPATVCGDGKTPVFADPLTLKGYGDCRVDGVGGQCHACVLIFTPKKSSSSSSKSTTSSSTSSHATGTAIPPAEGYFCRGLSGSDAEIPADCKALGMKGTRCPDGTAPKWYGQINPEKSECSLSGACSGRWGKCETVQKSSSTSSSTSSSVSSSTSSTTRTCPERFTCDMQCTGTRCYHVAIDCFANGTETAGSCGPDNQGQCVRCKISSTSSSSSKSSVNPCGDGICSENEGRILCVDPPAPPRVPDPNTRYGCFPVCALDCEHSTSSNRSSVIAGCGDGKCANTRTENAVSCPADCRTDIRPTCGDGICQEWTERARGTEEPIGCRINPATGKASGWCPAVCASDCNKSYNCPLPACAMPPPGCRSMSSGETGADGCLLHPCGTIVCGDTTSSSTSSSRSTSSSSSTSSTKRECPLPPCAMPPIGCRAEQTGERGSDGCLLHACGTLVCGSSSSSVKSSSSIGIVNCPLIKCAMPERGCSYVANAERNADGCPKFPCGRLVCPTTSSSASSAGLAVCVSSFSYDVNMRPVVGRLNCPLEQHCSTEDGVCNPPPGCSGTSCAAVCSGTCKPGASHLITR